MVRRIEIASAPASGGRERLDDRTSGQLAGRAAPYGIREHTLHSPQVSDFGPNFREVTCRELAHLSACALRIIR